MAAIEVRRYLTCQTAEQGCLGDEVRIGRLQLRDPMHGRRDVDGVEGVAVILHHRQNGRRSACMLPVNPCHRWTSHASRVTVW